MCPIEQRIIATNCGRTRCNINDRPGIRQKSIMRFRFSRQRSDLRCIWPNTFCVESYRTVPCPKTHVSSSCFQYNGSKEAQTSGVSRMNAPVHQSACSANNAIELTLTHPFDCNPSAPSTARGGDLWCPRLSRLVECRSSVRIAVVYLTFSIVMLMAISICIACEFLMSATGGCAKRKKFVFLLPSYLGWTQLFYCMSEEMDPLCHLRVCGIHGFLLMLMNWVWQKATVYY